MTYQLTPENLEKMAEKLYVYDVVQGAWEHEGKSVHTNVNHVFYHLVKDMTDSNKPLDGKGIIKALAPDNVQYALRLGRWTGNTPEEMIQDAAYYKDQTLGNVAEVGRLEVSRLATVVAIGKLAKNLHDTDHQKTHEDAEEALPQVAKHASAWLLYASVLQSDHHGINLEQAFDQRLFDLRERFNIPQP